MRTNCFITLPDTQVQRNNQMLEPRVNYIFFHKWTQATLRTSLKQEILKTTCMVYLHFIT